MTFHMKIFYRMKSRMKSDKSSSVKNYHCMKQLDLYGNALYLLNHEFIEYTDTDGTYARRCKTNRNP